MLPDAPTPDGRSLARSPALACSPPLARAWHLVSAVAGTREQFARTSARWAGAAPACTPCHMLAGCWDGKVEAGGCAVAALTAWTGGRGRECVSVSFVQALGQDAVLIAD
jgi:hypothetical protein